MMNRFFSVYVLLVLQYNVYSQKHYIGGSINLNAQFATTVKDNIKFWSLPIDSSYTFINSNVLLPVSLSPSISFNYYYQLYNNKKTTILYGSGIGYKYRKYVMRTDGTYSGNIPFILQINKQNHYLYIPQSIAVNYKKWQFEIGINIGLQFINNTSFLYKVNNSIIYNLTNYKNNYRGIYFDSNKPKFYCNGSLYLGYTFILPKNITLIPKIGSEFCIIDKDYFTLNLNPRHKNNIQFNSLNFCLTILNIIK